MDGRLGIHGGPYPITHQKENETEGWFKDAFGSGRQVCETHNITYVFMAPPLCLLKVSLNESSECRHVNWQLAALHVMYVHVGCSIDGNTIVLNQLININ